MNKTITHLSLRAAALLAVLVFTILAAPNEARAQDAVESYYILTLKSNYDGGPMANIPVSKPYTWTLNATKFDRDGYTIIGWAETADGAIIYGASEQITLTGDLTLYAKWQKLTCYVVFYANGGTGTMDPVQQGGSYTIPECGFTRDGYTFIGWATSPDGEAVYQPGMTITLTDDLALYAKWGVNCTVSFNSNDGTGTMNPVTQAGSYTIPACGFTRDGYTFIGWATSPDGEAVYQPGDDITLTGDLMLYAKWKVNPTVTFDKNGGTGTMDPVTQGGSYTIPECGFTREGYTFIGWATSASGNVEYQPGMTITLTDDLTLYAKWGINYTVSFYSNGGTGTMNPVTQGGSYTIPGCGFTKSGYVFIGWATSPDGAVVYLPMATIMLTGDLTLYAKWAEGIGGTCGQVNIHAQLDGTEVTWSLTKSEGSAGFDLLTISSSIVNGDMANYDYGESPWYAYRDQIKTIVIGDGVKTIGLKAFKDCTNAISVSFGNSVNEIEGKSFQGCTSLKSLNIPSSVTYIGFDAFYGCTGLRSVTIGNGVTIIDDYAFENCSQLSSVTIYAESVPYCRSSFSYNADGRKIYVPAASVNAYKNASGWSDYASDIEPLDVIIEDGNDKSVLTNGQTKNIALKRTFPRGKKQTVCLPFAPTELLNHGKVWQFTGISEEGGVKKAVMTEITSGPLSANTPYIFEATSDVWSMTFGEAAVNISNNPETKDATAGFTFHGTYEKKHWDANDDDVKNGRIYGFLMEDSEHDAARKEGMFVQAKYNTNVRPFSCYLEYSGELTGTQTTARRKASAEELPDVIEIEWKSAAEAPGETTGIDELRIKNLELRDDAWYSLDGRRLSGKPSVKGLYIHNGKLVIKN